MATKIGPKSSPSFRRNGRKPAPPRPDTSADLSDLAELDPEQLARHLSREALLITAGIMRQPGRHAAAQLSAAREILQRGCKPMAPDRDEAGGGNTFVVNVSSIPAPQSAVTVTAVTTRQIASRGDR